MRRFLRLLTLWLIALALPLQGAAAATAMGAHVNAPSHTMTMPDGTTMDAAAMPGAVSCHGHAIDKTGCGDCCAPVAAPQSTFAIAPVAVHWTPVPRGTVDAATPSFVTGGTDRPPRPFLA